MKEYTFRVTLKVENDCEPITPANLKHMLTNNLCLLHREEIIIAEFKVSTLEELQGG